MSLEKQVAEQIVHQERVSALLAKTGGEIMHPDHYELREAVRLAVLKAIDETTSSVCNVKMSDGELPNLFKTLDAIVSCVFLKSKGL